MTYVLLTGAWCDIVLDVHVPTEDKSDYTKNSFCEELECESESYVTTDGQPASLSWSKAPIWGLRPDLYYLCDSYGLVLLGHPL
jgi:hypothetical protein